MVRDDGHWACRLLEIRLGFLQTSCCLWWRKRGGWHCSRRACLRWKTRWPKRPPGKPGPPASSRTVSSLPACLMQLGESIADRCGGPGAFGSVPSHRHGLHGLLTSSACERRRAASLCGGVRHRRQRAGAAGAGPGEPAGGGRGGRGRDLARGVPQAPGQAQQRPAPGQVRQDHGHQPRARGRAAPAAPAGRALASLSICVHRVIGPSAAACTHKPSTDSPHGAPLQAAISPPPGQHVLVGVRRHGCPC